MTCKRVDFHCHLDLYPDYAGAVSECDVKEIYTLAVTTTPKAWPRNREIASRTRHVRAALGLHPQLVALRAGELPLWEGYVSETRYIGEVGLDGGPRFYSSLPQQNEVFRRMLEVCARRGNKILTVHSVRAVKPVLDLIEKYLPQKSGRVVLHWFTGTKAEARRAIDLGCYFSVNGEMLTSTRHSEMLAMIPMGRLLTETDGPFTKIDGRVARPCDVGVVLEQLAHQRGLAPKDVADAVVNNLRDLVESKI